MTLHVVDLYFELTLYLDDFDQSFLAEDDDDDDDDDENDEKDEDKDEDDGDVVDAIMKILMMMKKIFFRFLLYVLFS